MAQVRPVVVSLGEFSVIQTGDTLKIVSGNVDQLIINDELTLVGPLLLSGSSGTAGQVLTSAGQSSPPTWTNIPSAPVTSVNAKTGDVVLTKADIGLGNVDNTSDLLKPISTATQTALDLKVSKSGDTMTGALNAPEVKVKGPLRVENLGNTDVADITLTRPHYGRLNFSVPPNNSRSEVRYVSKGATAGSGQTYFVIASSEFNDNGDNLLMGVASGATFLTNAYNYTAGGPLKLGGQSWSGNGILNLNGETNTGTVSVFASTMTVSGTLSASNLSGTNTGDQDLSGYALITTSISAGTGLTGGGDLSANRTIALNAASIASLAKADTAIQSADLGTMAYQNASAVTITGGTINATSIGATTRSTGAFTDLVTTNDAYINGVRVGRGNGGHANNTVLGAGALAVRTGGASIVAIGLNALGKSTTGTSNVVIGANAGAEITTGNSNNFLGYLAGGNITTGSNNVLLGAGAGMALTTSSNANTIVGADAGAESGAAVAGTTLIGFNAGRKTVSAMIAIGYQAARDATGSMAGSIAIGNDTLRYATGLSQEAIAIGNQAGRDWGIAGGNVQYNVAIGRFAGQQRTTGGGAVFVGNQAGQVSNGINTVSIGNGAGYLATQDNSCVNIGPNSGRGANNANANLTGTNNVFIGVETGPASPTQLSYATAIGGYAVVGTSNTVVLGRTSDTTVIGGTSAIAAANGKLQVYGTVYASEGIKILDDRGSGRLPAYYGDCRFQWGFHNATSLGISIPGGNSYASTLSFNPWLGSGGFNAGYRTQQLIFNAAGLGVYRRYADTATTWSTPTKLLESGDSPTLLNMSTARILGRSTAATGPVEEITIGSGLTLSSGTLTATGSGGTVTSVAMSVPTGLSISGTPITTSGTLALTYTSGYQGYTTTEATKLAGIAPNANNYILPAATSTILGGIEIFSDTVQSVASNAVSTTAARTYGIQVNAAGQAVVNVPWVDTNTTYSGSTSITLSGTSFQRAALTGDVTAAANNNDTTIANGVVTNAKLANVAAFTIKGRNLATTGAVMDMSAADVRGMLNVANGATVGADWATNLTGIPANITSWAGVAPSNKVNVAGDTMTGALNAPEVKVKGPLRVEKLTNTDVADITLTQPYYSRLNFFIPPSNEYSEVRFVSKGATAGNGQTYVLLASTETGNNGTNLLLGAKTDRAFITNAHDYATAGALHLGGSGWNSNGVVVITGIAGPTGVVSVNGSISASNLTGTNTGDQDLSGLAPKIRTIFAGTGLTGGGDLSANRTIALNSASIASLAKADSAIQAASLGNMAYQNANAVSITGEFVSAGTFKTGSPGEPGRWRYHDSTGYLMSFWTGGTLYDDWGLHWDGSPNVISWRGDNNVRWSVSLNNGDTVQSGTMTATAINVNAATVAGSAVWHAGNFNPATKANSGAIGSSLLTMSTARILGRSTAATGAVEELTATDVATFLDTEIRDIPVIVNPGDINLAQSHLGRTLAKTNSTAQTISIQPNSSVAIKNGTPVTFANMGGTTGDLTVARAGTTQIWRNGTDANLTIAPGNSITLVKIATNTWQA